MDVADPTPFCQQAAGSMCACYIAVVGRLRRRASSHTCSTAIISMCDANVSPQSSQANSILKGMKLMCFFSMLPWAGSALRVTKVEEECKSEGVGQPFNTHMRVSLRADQWGQTLGSVMVHCCEAPCICIFCGLRCNLCRAVCGRLLL